MTSRFQFFRYAIEIFGAWWGVMSGALSVPLGLLALLNAWSQQRTLGILAIVSAWVAMFSMARRNRRLMDRLEPKLEIEGIESELNDPKDKIQRVRVRNCSGDLTADDVEVQLLAVEYEYSANGNPSLPKSLLPEKQDARSIDPSNARTFDLLTASFNSEWQEQTPGALPQRRYPVWVSTTVPGDLHRSVYTGFDTDKKYRVKVKATARNFPPTIQDFDMEFSTSMSLCRFQLTKTQSSFRRR